MLIFLGHPHLFDEVVKLEFVHTDLVGPIKPVGFAGERYFFTFTDDCTRMTETYTGTEKSDWLRCLKTYHSLCRTRSKEEHPIERLRSDYGSELQSHKANDWMQKEGITFETSAPYSQEQNGVSERMERTIMDIQSLKAISMTSCGQNSYLQ